VVGAQAELFFIQVLMEISSVLTMANSSHLGDAAISLGLVHHLTVVGYYVLLSVLNLGEHSSNPEVTCVFVNDEPLSWLLVGTNRAVQSLSQIRLTIKMGFGLNDWIYCNTFTQLGTTGNKVLSLLRMLYYYV
jgi:hypothetical protein